MPIWNARLAVGVPEIDQQHQELFQRADALLDAMRAGRSADEVGRLLRFLEEYCTRHFATEERLMRDRRSPRLDVHLAQHAIFVDRFKQIATQFQAKGASATTTMALQDLVAGWLVQHIGAVDTQLAAVLAQKPAAAAR